VSGFASAAAPTRGPAVAAAARVRGVPLAVVVAIAAAWAAAIAAEATGASALLHHDSLLSDGLPSAWAVVGFLAAWQVMVTAMMLPSSLPLVGMFAAASVRAPRSGRAMAAFLSGYALVWTAFAALAFAGDVALHTFVNASSFLADHEWAIGGSVIALAGLFQFTPLKDACLEKCRHPASFMVRHYRRGARGGFALGARHGLFCVGCCWALMLVMFAVGATNLTLMALLTALMVHEKSRPAGRRAVPVTGVTLLAVASVVLAYSAYATYAA
jgi:predicted metal-binding membrane protein